jgi:hypothetical protein
MTAVLMPAPAILGPPPADDHADGDPRRNPAPVATILAVLGTIASHAGDPTSVTVTEPVHAITVNVDDRQRYAAWREMTASTGELVRDDHLGVLARSQAQRYGWLITVQIAAPA